MDICDRILCPIKAAIITFCNEGHYILTANDMHTAALNEWLVKGTTTTVCSVDQSNKNAEGKKLESFNQFYNYSSLRVWRCYCIGNGKFAPYTS